MESKIRNFFNDLSDEFFKLLDTIESDYSDVSDASQEDIDITSSDEESESQLDVIDDLKPEFISKTATIEPIATAEVPAEILILTGIKQLINAQDLQTKRLQAEQLLFISYMLQEKKQQQARRPLPSALITQSAFNRMLALHNAEQLLSELIIYLQQQPLSKALPVRDEIFSRLQLELPKTITKFSIFQAENPNYFTNKLEASRINARAAELEGTWVDLGSATNKSAAQAVEIEEPGQQEEKRCCVM